jgi:hypothetical protein
MLCAVSGLSEDVDDLEIEGAMNKTQINKLLNRLKRDKRGTAARAADTE